MPEHIAQILLNQAHSPDTATAIFNDKVLHKPLLLRPTSPDPNSQDARAKRRLVRLRKKERLQRRQKPKPLSAKEKRKTGIYDVPDDAKKHESYKPLHQMWVGYMWEILGMKEGEPCFVTAQSAGSKLASADYHGAQLAVTRSKCAGMVGLEGIVVKDTKFTFQVITEKNELKIIPKRFTVFGFDIPQPRAKEDTSETSDKKSENEARPLPRNLVFELHGSQFEHRPTDRATKKFKPRSMTDL